MRSYTRVRWNFNAICMLSLLKEEEKIDVEGTVPRDEEAETEVLQLQTEQ